MQPRTASAALLMAFPHAVGVSTGGEGNQGKAERPLFRSSPEGSLLEPRVHLTPRLWALGWRRGRGWRWLRLTPLSSRSRTPPLHLDGRWNSGMRMKFLSRVTTGG